MEKARQDAKTQRSKTGLGRHIPAARGALETTGAYAGDRAEQAYRGERRDPYTRKHFQPVLFGRKKVYSEVLEERGDR